MEEANEMSLSSIFDDTAFPSSEPPATASEGQQQGVGEENVTTMMNHDDDDTYHDYEMNGRQALMNGGEVATDSSSQDPNQQQEQQPAAGLPNNNNNNESGFDATRTTNVNINVDDGDRRVSSSSFSADVADIIFGDSGGGNYEYSEENQISNNQNGTLIGEENNTPSTYDDPTQQNHNVKEQQQQSVPHEQQNTRGNDDSSNQPSPPSLPLPPQEYNDELTNSNDASGQALPPPEQEHQSSLDSLMIKEMQGQQHQLPPPEQQQQQQRQNSLDSYMFQEMQEQQQRQQQQPRGSIDSFMMKQIMENSEEQQQQEDAFMNDSSTHVQNNYDHEMMIPDQRKHPQGQKQEEEQATEVAYDDKQYHQEHNDVSNNSSDDVAATAAAGNPMQHRPQKQGFDDENSSFSNNPNVVQNGSNHNEFTNRPTQEQEKEEESFQAYSLLSSNDDQQSSDVQVNNNDVETGFMQQQLQQSPNNSHLANNNNTNSFNQQQHESVQQQLPPPPQQQPHQANQTNSFNTQQIVQNGNGGASRSVVQQQQQQQFQEQTPQMYMNAYGQLDIPSDNNNGLISTEQQQSSPSVQHAPNDNNSGITPMQQQQHPGDMQASSNPQSYMNPQMQNTTNYQPLHQQQQGRSMQGTFNPQLQMMDHHMQNMETRANRPVLQMPQQQLQQSNSSQASNTLAPQHQSTAQLPQAQQNDGLVELLDSDDDDDGPQAKRHRSGITHPVSSSSNNQGAAAAAEAASMARNANMPQWMNNNQQQHRPKGNKIIPGYSIQEYRIQQQQEQMKAAAAMRPGSMQQQQHEGGGSTRHSRQNQPVYVQLPPNFTPTWRQPLPPPPRPTPTNQKRRFALSLLNVQEFTITGVPIYYEGPPSSLAGLRSIIKDVSKDYGKATFEREGDEGRGRWKIPLGAYPAFYSYLSNAPLIEVEGIPAQQLNIASLGRAILEKGYPSSIKLINKGVPIGLAKALAPFQRGGVDFVIEKEGRALIADDMGLGKTIQAIASMSVYHNEWPVLVLTPSSARFHWEAEFQQWLCKNSNVNKAASDDDLKTPSSDMTKSTSDGNDENNGEDDEPEEIMNTSRCMPLMDESQIHVLMSSKDEVLPSSNTRVVICSYGLAPMLVNNGRIRPSLFQCAIVDESHMLKNIKSKRTSALVPVLHATNRCILLSGTPALARPSELWPQLKVLGTERKGWWDNEEEFYSNYVRKTSAVRRAELHALLTGTVMIRRLKNDILKSMLPKIRQKAVVDVSTHEQRKQFHQYMLMLKEGKGVLGKLARQHSAFETVEPDVAGDAAAPKGNAEDIDAQIALLKRSCAKEFEERRAQLYHQVHNYQNQLNPAQRNELLQRTVGEMQRQIGAKFIEKQRELQGQKDKLREDAEQSRKTVLNDMYTLTARAKLPFIVDSVERWLNDPTKGKLCLFAHHIFVLDEVIKSAGLSNAEGSDKRYIRIDGSTSPKVRQQQIKTFQNDPGVRIAVLGITAAGVAVTLTASSTVWFTELFWTPALMIQAEDRCHRIGQNSQVKCLYFVATGTLDELLWKLLEKKFRDLGEFVEGKEKLNMVVHQTYEGLKEYHTQYFASASDDESEDGTSQDDELDEDRAELMQMQEDLEAEISMLGKEELTAIKSEEDDDEPNSDTKPEETFSESKLPAQNAVGSTEAEAICLSDSEDEAVEVVEKKPKSEPGHQNAVAPSQKSMVGNTAPNTSLPFYGSKIYKLTFEGVSYGINIIVYNQRLVVRRKMHQNLKPQVGDILIAVDSQIVPFMHDTIQITKHLKDKITRGPVTLTFLEVESFTRFFNIGTKPTEAAIEILDDDDD